MSDDKPRRGYSLGDEPDFDLPEEGSEETSALHRSRLEDHSWFRASAKPTPVPQRALQARDEWADVPFGEEPKPRPTAKPRPTPPAVTLGGTPIAEPGASLHPDEVKRRKLRTSLLLTAASTVLPGSGLLGAPQRWLKVVGAATALGALALGLYFLNWALRDTASFASIAVDPDFLNRASVSLIVLGLVWVALIATTHIATRPGGLQHGRRLLGAAIVAALAFGVSAPSALGARYSHDQIMLVERVFGPGGDTGDGGVQSTSRPTLATEPQVDPWKDVPRVNVLLLGADGNEARADEVEKYSVRTDTIMVASIDTATGDTLLVQIPRNVQYTPFPENSEMAEAFPRGFRGEPEAEWLVNSIWAKVELDYPNLLQGNTYRGAEALKEGVEGITGLEIDYFMMLDIDGLQQLINAMGGVVVNINEPLPKGTATNCRDEDRCLLPGPNQRLNGYDAMWYARSRKTTSDYSRMARQSCLIDAVIKQANPATMLTSYEGIAQAASHMVTTDIPQRDLKAFVQLAFRVKDAKVQRLVYSPGKNGYSYADPDFEAMRQSVEDALNPPSPTPTAVAPTSVAPTSAAPSTPAPAEEETTASPSPSGTPEELQEGAQTVADACAWNGEAE
ncbi:LCP family protein [Tessaracoccus sp. MC1865]|uniref:LCP family protein n=1 Tax=Tessaracoccus sp. MC1865 TaxID=2760310 RepID=UPI001602445E|nr:LCP family protein [Tessaracoccus sp. MC1865]MBB1482800.1 LCP family protein [Tessaracoccus sp. MC1865]QTO37755.1 LCP family protein [Tessaracoccus sp. MC1865]